MIGMSITLNTARSIAAPTCSVSRSPTRNGGNEFARVVGPYPPREEDDIDVLAHKASRFGSVGPAIRGAHRDLRVELAAHGRLPGPWPRAREPGPALPCRQAGAGRDGYPAQ